MLWKAVRRLLHPGPGVAWYERLDTDALATGLCDFFVDKVKQVKVKVEHSLHGTPNDNRLTEPTLIKPQRSLKSFACVTASEIERLIKSANLAIRSTTNFCCQVVQCGVIGHHRSHLSRLIAFHLPGRQAWWRHYSKNRASTLTTSRASGQ